MAIRTSVKRYIHALGFYLNYTSLVDFILFKEIVYAEVKGYTWFDLGWTCNSGVELFKREWAAEPRFEILTQEYVKRLKSSSQ